jgi:hypothetical protein
VGFLKKPIILWIWLVLVAVTLFFVLKSGISLTPDNPEYIAIENTLRKYLEINAEARYTLDDSRLSEVLANDSRGSYSTHDGNSALAKAVRWYTGNPLVMENHIGMLDFWHAYYAYNRQVKQLYNAAVAKEGQSSSQVAAPISPESLPEVRQLMEETGFQGASLPPARPQVIVPENFVIESVKVFLGEAYVVGDYPYARVGLTFVKRSGQWYLVGSKILQWHGG